MTCRKILSTLLVISITLGATARKCYVCGPSAEKPFQSVNEDIQKIHKNCEATENMEMYAMDCPVDYQSCLTQVEDDKVVRTCGEASTLNECKSANNIDFCYCDTDLCNNLSIEDVSKQAETHHEHVEVAELKQKQQTTDDEDLSESSGLEETSGKMVMSTLRPDSLAKSSEESKEDKTLDTTVQNSATGQPNQNGSQRFTLNLIFVIFCIAVSILIAKF